MLERSRQTPTDVRVPDDVFAALGSRQAPVVVMTVHGLSWRRSAMLTSGGPWLGVGARNRAPTGLATDEVLDIDLELDAAVGEVGIPRERLAGLGVGPKAPVGLSALSCRSRRGIVISVDGARTVQTWRRRISRRVAGAARQLRLATRPRTAPFRRQS